MRISELSRRSGVPVATVKYYLREGLLPPGEATAPNQADYGDGHLHRLRLVRVLLEVGGLPLAAVRAVLAAVDDAQVPVLDMLGRAHHALGPADRGPVPPEVTVARREVGAFLAERGWQVSAEAPARHALADALVALRRLGRDADVEAFAPYAELADTLAAREIGFLSGEAGGAGSSDGVDGADPAGGAGARVAGAASRSALVEQVVVGTVVFEAVLVALRRLAQEHHSAARWAGRDPP